MTAVLIQGTNINYFTELQVFFDIIQKWSTMWLSGVKKSQGIIFATFQSPLPPLELFEEPIEEVTETKYLVWDLWIPQIPTRPDPHELAESEKRKEAAMS
ncbi:hypothetical protein AVEN_175319-1 [Araneus ventricosus]|uniref:Uncharacterized protein n=1 Tax=Araneus ventricosus TaxID=182803 RepID=A0A4Y2GI92_ARAVE|nr:hypothetical protein AVEN_175319-1 [Araneus ventricosus]